VASFLSLYVGLTVDCCLSSALLPHSSVCILYLFVFVLIVFVFGALLPLRHFPVLLPRPLGPFVFVFVCICFLSGISPYFCRVHNVAYFVSVIKQPVVRGGCILVILQPKHFAIYEPWFLFSFIGPNDFAKSRTSFAFQTDVEAQRLNINI